MFLGMFLTLLKVELLGKLLRKFLFWSKDYDHSRLSKILLSMIIKFE